MRGDESLRDAKAGVDRGGFDSTDSRPGGEERIDDGIAGDVTMRGGNALAQEIGLGLFRGAEMPAC